MNDGTGSLFVSNHGKGPRECRGVTAVGIHARGCEFYVSPIRGKPMKRKPKVEAWAITNCGKPVAVSLDKPGPRLDPDAVKVVRLTPADPHAKLKAAVVRAARAMLVALAAPGRDPHGHAELDLLAALGNLDEAVQKLQKVKP